MNVISVVTRYACHPQIVNILTYPLDNVLHSTTIDNYDCVDVLHIRVLTKLKFRATEIELFKFELASGPLYASAVFSCTEKVIQGSTWGLDIMQAFFVCFLKNRTNLYCHMVYILSLYPESFSCSPNHKPLLTG